MIFSNPACMQHGMAPACLNQLDRSGIRLATVARSSPSSVIIYTRAVRSVILSDNHWPSLVSCCSRSRLKHIACPCPVITIYRNLSPTAEDILVSTVISGHHHPKLLTMLSWISKCLLLFRHVKNR